MEASIELTDPNATQPTVTLREHVLAVVLGATSDDFDIPAMRKLALAELPPKLAESFAKQKDEWADQKIDALIRSAIRSLDRDDGDQLSLALDGGYQIAPQKWKRRKAISFEEWTECFHRMDEKDEASRTEAVKKRKAFIEFGRQQFGPKVDAIVAKAISNEQK